MEVALSRRQTKSAARNPPVDPRHERCQPTLGCSPDPWRTPQARHQCGSNLGRQIYGRSAGTPIARMEDVPARCCTGLCQFRPNRVKYGRTRTTSTTLFRVCQQCRVSVSPGRVRDYSPLPTPGTQGFRQNSPSAPCGGKCAARSRPPCSVRRGHLCAPTAVENRLRRNQPSPRPMRTESTLIANRSQAWRSKNSGDSKTPTRDWAPKPA